MRNKLTYKHTMLACFYSNFFQGVGSVFPIIFTPLRSFYGLTYTQLGVLVTVNFITQVSAGLLFSKPVDKAGFRPFAVAAPTVSAIGLLLFSAAPFLWKENVFAGFCLGIFIYAAGGGLEELLLSPILDALPQPKENKARSMSLLHSFFAWGQIFIVLVSTGILALAGAEIWIYVVAGWAIVKVGGSVFFAMVPMYARVPAGKEMPMRSLFKSPVFILSLCTIIFGAASEVTMAQWASAFIERGLALPKLLGDMLGVCGFAFFLALGRTMYGIKGRRVSIHTLMIWGSAGAVVSYFIAGVSSSAVVGLAACGLTGLFTSLLWPGSVIVSGRHLPLAGASMYALLSVFGDLGAAGGSFITGRIADTVQKLPFLESVGEQAGLRAGILFASLFAVGSLLSNIFLRKAAEKAEAGKAG